MGNLEKHIQEHRILGVFDKDHIDTDDFQLSGENLQIKDSGIHHGGLSGNDDDDHKHYALLDGRSGGQTLYGGYKTGENLTFHSTSHATKGFIYLGDGWKIGSDGHIYGNSGYQLRLDSRSESSPGYSFFGDSDTGIYRPATNEVGISTGGTEAVRIDSDGKVGIGTSSPDHPLSVTKSGEATVQIFGADSGDLASIELGKGGSGDRYAYVDLTGDDTYTDYGLRLIRGNSGANTTSELVHRGTGNLQLRTADAGDLVFKTSSATRMTIDSGGDIGIGNDSPNYRLDVKVDDASGYAARFWNDGNDENRYGVTIYCGEDDQSASIGYHLRCYDGDGDHVGGLRHNAGTVEVYQASDEVLKEDINLSSLDGLSIVQNLPLKEFRFKRKKKDDKQGTLHRCDLVAQDCQQVFPEMVEQDPEAGLLTIAPTKLIPVLLKAIQQLSSKVQKLEANCASLYRNDMMS